MEHGNPCLPWVRGIVGWKGDKADGSEPSGGCTVLSWESILLSGYESGFPTLSRAVCRLLPGSLSDSSAGPFLRFSSGESEK